MLTAAKIIEYKQFIYNYLKRDRVWTDLEKMYNCIILWVIPLVSANFKSS